MKLAPNPLLPSLLAAVLPGLALAQDVVVAEANYASGQATAHVVAAVIEDALGLEVETLPSAAVPVIYEAMARGQGEIDIWTETWVPNQSGPIATYVEGQGTVTLGGNSFPAVQGYCVPRAAAEAHGIRTVFDLASPDNAALFDTNGDGRGEIWIGAQGWLSTNIETIRARDYGFADFFELQSTDEAVATAGLDAAVREGRPWVGYCYGPHQNFAMYDLVLLEEPPHDPEAFVMVQPTDDPDWQQKSHVASAYADTSVHISWSTSLAERQPEVVRLLENIQLSADDVNDWSLRIVEGAQPADVARAWVEANPEIVAGWMAP